MKVDGATAPGFGMKVDLPGLAKGVGLYEVAFVVHMKTVLGGVLFEVGDEPGDVDGH
jgi:hypothetical protein